jgi:hypothetical protein
MVFFAFLSETLPHLSRSIPQAVPTSITREQPESNQGNNWVNNWG